MIIGKYKGGQFNCGVVDTSDKENTFFSCPNDVENCEDYENHLRKLWQSKYYRSIFVIYVNFFSENQNEVKFIGKYAENAKKIFITLNDKFIAERKSSLLLKKGRNKP